MASDKLAEGPPASNSPVSKWAFYHGDLSANRFRNSTPDYIKHYPVAPNHAHLLWLSIWAPADVSEISMKA